MQTEIVDEALYQAAAIRKAYLERHSHVDPQILSRFLVLFSRQAHLEIPALLRIANMSENRARP